MITAVVIVKDDGFYIRKTIDPNYKHCTIPIVLEYLAEGGANVVLRLVPFAKVARIPCPPQLRDRLLRVRKDKPFIAPAQLQHKHFTDTFSPFFEANQIVGSFLVTIDNQVLESVNRELDELQADGLRSPKRYGDKVAVDETHSVLMMDMSPIGAEVCLEIKPKWLTQSRDAPAEAKRCRTCALRAQRARAGHLDPVAAVVEGYCPLALVSDNKEAEMQAAYAIMKANKTEWMTEREQAFIGILPIHVRPVLEKIRDYQLQYDKEGVLSLKEGAEPSADYLIAMTLRDCAMFVKAPESLRAGPIEVRLADLDAKTPHPEKVKKWRETERALLDEGWYMNTEEDAKKDDICLLSKQPTS